MAEIFHRNDDGRLSVPGLPESRVRRHGLALAVAALVVIYACIEIGWWRGISIPTADPVLCMLRFFRHTCQRGHDLYPAVEQGVVTLMFAAPVLGILFALIAGRHGAVDKVGTGSPSFWRTMAFVGWLCAISGYFIFGVALMPYSADMPKTASAALLLGQNIVVLIVTWGITRTALREREKTG
jgi:hypothetical protein